MRFVVPVRTVHAGPNPKYFGTGRGVTWYNLISDQFSGLNAITVPGTLRDSLVLLAVVLEQQTELQPTQIMTDTGAYSDVVFGLFRLLGYHFSPRLADVGGTRFWRTRPDADYGKLNGLARQSVKLDLIAEHWDDLLRLAGSLKLGRVPATGIMRTLQTGDRPTRLAQALAEFGRIEKTLHTLTYIDDESKRRATLTQLNRGEGRHSLARAVFHGKRGELRQRYREGQEDQLGALGLVVNIIVLWNTLYMTAAVERLKQHGYPVLEEDLARLSPLIYEHINMLGRYSFAVPEEVARASCGHCVIQTTTCDPPKRYEQHPSCCWIGGHFTEPNEQKTQQSLGWGAAAPCSCCTRNRTGRRPWAWFPAWRSRSAGKSARTQGQWRSS
jgi:TnpA family transposase